MNLNSLTLLFVLAMFLVSCGGSMKISSSKVTKGDVQQYKSYAWVAPGDTALNSRRDDKMYSGLIVKSANEELQKKGMTLDSQNPDVVFMFDTRVREDVEYRKIPDNRVRTYNSYGYSAGGYGVYYAGGYNPMQNLESTSVITEKGTLTYLMYDRKTDKLVWQGSTTRDLTAKTNIEATIKRATKFIFAELPIKHK